jgi:hypothetical protein
LYITVRRFIWNCEQWDYFWFCLVWRLKGMIMAVWLGDLIEGLEFSLGLWGFGLWSNEIGTFGV